MKKCLLVLIGVLACQMLPVWAVKMSGLYQVALPIASQSDGLLVEAVRQGFIQVLTRVSGDLSIASNAVIAPTLGHVMDYVQEYRYTPSGDTRAAAFILHVRYDAPFINQLLNKAGVDYWKESRPLILVWLAVTNADNVTDMVSEDVHPDILKAMQTQGERSGLQLIFPMMDSADMDLVSAATIVNRNVVTLKEAGKRYAPEAMLIGHIKAGAPFETGQWQLVVNATQSDFETEGTTISQLTGAALNQVTQKLSKHVTAKSADVPERWLTLAVESIVEKSDLAALVQYLKQLSLGRKVQLLSVTGTRVEMDVLVNGSPAMFQQAAEAGLHLELISEDEENETLMYDWVH